MTARITCLVALLCAGLSACSEHQSQDGALGGAQMSDASRAGTAGLPTSGAGGAGNNAGTRGTEDAGDTDATVGGAELECIIAYRLDTCCFEGVAVTRAEVQADPCLIEYPEPDVDNRIDGEDVERCRPERCEAVVCPVRRPRSFRAASTATGCVFADECEQASDCVLAKEIGPCCACGEAMPASVALSQACYLADSEEPQSTGSCPYGCFDDIASCGACAARAAPTCLMRDGLKVCH